MKSRLDDFEHAISELTSPLNGQFPRPWMTDLRDPLTADVFIVGKNQAKGYPQSIRGGHARHLDALFNRNGESCRGLHDEITGGSPCPTRVNSDWVVSKLKNVSASRILESNVICYSSPMSADSRLDIQSGGAERGRELFEFLYISISPQVMIVHGAGATKELCKFLKLPLLRQPSPLTGFSEYRPIPP